MGREGQPNNHPADRIPHVLPDVHTFAAWCRDQKGTSYSADAEVARAFYERFPSYLLGPEDGSDTPGMVVVNKPPGISSQTGNRHNPYALDEVTRMALGADAHCVNRLDRDTSGIIILGTDRSTRASLSKQFEKKTVEKSYVAVIAGKLNPTIAGVIAPLAESAERRSIILVDPWSPKARNAATGFRSLATIYDPENGTHSSVIQVRLLTGRTHQIRVHAQAVLGQPIIGDQKYNSDPAGADRQLLHSYTLRIRRPGKIDTLTYKAPPPDDFYKFFEGKHIMQADPQFFAIFDRLDPEYPPYTA